MHITVQPVEEYWCVTTQDAVVTFPELHKALNYSFSKVEPGSAKVIRVFEAMPGKPHEILYKRFVPIPAAKSTQRRRAKTGARAMWPSRLTGK